MNVTQQSRKCISVSRPVRFLLPPEHLQKALGVTLESARHSCAMADGYLEVSACALEPLNLIFKWPLGRKLKRENKPLVEFKGNGIKIKKKQSSREMAEKTRINLKLIIPQRVPWRHTATTSKNSPP